MAALAWLACCGPSVAPPASDAAARRIVVMAPAAAEMLAALERLDRVVGVGDFVREPAQLAALPRVGAYDAPNVERVLELQADLLITVAGVAGADVHRRLETLGVRVLALRTDTFEGVFSALAEVGRAVDAGTEAERLAGRMRAELDSIAERAAGRPRPAVLVVVGRDPLYVAGPGSHLDEMIVLAGGRNTAADLGTSYARISLEAILERMPEVIIDTSHSGPGAPRGAVPGEWGRWPFLPAVRDGRVYHVDPSLLVVPGMRLVEMTRSLGRLIQPGVFGEPADDDFRAR